MKKVVLVLTAIAVLGAVGGSTTIALTVNAITGPASIQVLTKDPVSFSVTTEGYGPFSYQWKKGGSPIADATTSVYGIASAALTDNGAYSCTATSAIGVPIDSATATLTVNQRLTETQAPMGMSKVEGGSGSFMVGVTGVSPYTYQWQKNNTITGVWDDRTGATSDICSFSNITTADAGNYRCHVGDSYAQTLDSTEAELVVLPAATSPTLYLSYAGGGATQMTGHINPHGYLLADLLENPGSLPGGTTYADITAVGIKFILTVSPFNLWEQDTVVSVSQNANSTPDTVYDACISQTLDCQIRPYFLIGGTRYYLKNSTVKVNLTYGGAADLATSGNAWLLNLTAPLP